MLFEAFKIDDSKALAKHYPHPHIYMQIIKGLFSSCASPRSSAMEEDSRGRAPSTPQLLNLIRGEGEWKVVREAADGGRSSRTTSSEAEEDTELELKLGLPGVQEEEGPAGPREKMQQEQESCTALSLGCFPSHSRLAASTATATGAKRGFLATVGAKAEGKCTKEIKTCSGLLVQKAAISFCF